MLVIEYSTLIRPCAYTIFQHFFVYSMVCIGVKVVVFGRLAVTVTVRRGLIFLGYRLCGCGLFSFYGLVLGIGARFCVGDTLHALEGFKVPLAASAREDGEALKDTGS